MKNALFLLLLILPSVAVAGPRERLNVILIMADDSAADNYGCYGSRYFQTPVLDRLAATGARFEHCYSEPVCTSSRVKIMTGRDGWRNYVRFGTLDKSETTFGNMLKSAGYKTAVAGKWQLHGGPNGVIVPDCGFDSWCVWNYPGTGRNRFWNPSLNQNGELLNSEKSDYGPDIVNQFVLDFIRNNKEEPFFVYYPMLLVHSPFVHTPDSKSPEATPLSHFKDMTAYADKLVGRVVDTLEELKLRRNTIVIYTTDNGTGRSLTYPFGGKQRKGEKAWATDGGTHAPLIVNCPGRVKEGTVCSDLVDFADFLPTLAEITESDLPDLELDGQSFWPQCLGKPGNARPWIRQYYYPRFGPAAEPHGQGVNGREIVWAQNQHYKLYRDGAFYAVSDRYEKTNILPGDGDATAERTRKMLQAAIDEIPEKAVKLNVTPAKK